MANKVLAAVRGVVTEAWRLGIVDSDRYRRVVDVKGVKGSTLPKGRALTAAEIEALFKACAADPSPAGSRDAALLALGYAAGLRRAEIVRPDLADYNSSGVLVVRGKGNKERRVFVTNGAADALAAWFKVRGDVAGPLFAPIRKGGHVAHGRLAPQSVYDVLTARAAQAGIERPSPHDLRRSCISDLLDRGNDLAVVQRLAGHASPVTTARYDRRPDDAARRAAETLSVLFVAGASTRSGGHIREDAAGGGRRASPAVVVGCAGAPRGMEACADSSAP